MSYNNCTRVAEEEKEEYDEEAVLVSTLGGVATLVCIVINILLLASVSIRSNKSHPLPRLLTCLCAVSLLALVANIAQVVVGVASCRASWYPPTCVSIAFLNQLASWPLLLLSLWLAVALALKYRRPDHAHHYAVTLRKEAAVWIAVVLLSVAMAAIPLGTGAYGRDRAWCWLKWERGAERWALWHAWAALVAPGAAAVAMVMTTCRRRAAARRGEVYYESSRSGNDSNSNNNSNNSGANVTKQLETLVVCAVLYWVVVAAVTTLDQFQRVRSKLAFLVGLSLLRPLGVLALPLAFAVHLHGFRKFAAAKGAWLGRRKGRGKGEAGMDDKAGKKSRKEEKKRKNKKKRRLEVVAGNGMEGRGEMVGEELAEVSIDWGSVSSHSHEDMTESLLTTIEDSGEFNNPA